MTTPIRIACVVAAALSSVTQAQAQGTATETGTPPGGGGNLLSMTLGATFCIPKSGSLVVDFPAQLPGPGVVSAPGELDLSQVLPLGLMPP